MDLIEMLDQKLPVEEYFKYHPPLTESRKIAHAKVNELALEFAKGINELVRDEECKRMAFNAVLQAKMFANQGITVDELKQS